jgi:outer membrane protein assembly complex protein YaeT
MQVQTAGRLLSHGRYSEAMLAQDVGNIQNLYRASGYRQVEVTSKLVENYGGNPYKLGIDMTVNEGPQTRVASVRFDGNYNVPTDQLIERAHIQTQEGQAFDEKVLTEDQENILTLYFNNGFSNANVDVAYVAVESAPKDKPEMGVVFTVHEGEQFFVSNVYLTGLHFTRYGVAHRQVVVKPGGPLSQQDMLISQRNLYSLALFNEVDTAIQNPDGSESHKNILIDMQEAKRYTFDYGVGFEIQTGQPSVGSNSPLGETGASPRVSFGLNRINFGGRNQTVAMRTNLSRLQQRGLISFSAPNFTNRDLIFSMTALYDNTIDVSTFTSERTEGTIKAEQILKRDPNDPQRILTSLTYGFSYRRVQASRIAVTEDLIPLLSKPTRVGEPSILYLRNRRDEDFESTRGNYTTVDGGVAAGVFGSEADFGRVLIKNTTYHAFAQNPRTKRAFVFARSTSIGVQLPFGDTILLGPSDPVPPGHSLIPLPERFYSGGGNSHRGFGLNQAGPRDPFTGFPIGGSALFLNNLELRFPNITMPWLQDNIGFTLFHDMGNVFDTPRHMFESLGRWHQSNPEVCLQEITHLQCTYNYLSHAVGIGIRYQTPIGPLRFDFGYNLNPPAFPSYTNVTTNQVNGVSTGQFSSQHAGHFNFSFSVGQSF